MNDLSTKAQTVVFLLKKLDATSEEKWAHVYQLLNELECTDLKPVFPEVEGYELDSLRLELTQKSVSTTLASLVRKGVVKKTGLNSVKVDGSSRNLRGYYLA